MGGDLELASGKSMAPELKWQLDAPIGRLADVRLTSTGFTLRHGLPTHPVHSAFFFRRKQCPMSTHQHAEMETALAARLGMRTSALRAATWRSGGTALGRGWCDAALSLWDGLL